MNAPKLRAEVAKYLKRTGLSQEAFARKCDVSLSALTKFLREERKNPRMDTADKLERGMQG